MILLRRLHTERHMLFSQEGKVTHPIHPEQLCSSEQRNTMPARTSRVFKKTDPAVHLPQCAAVAAPDGVRPGAEHANDLVFAWTSQHVARERARCGQPRKHSEGTPARETLAPRRGGSTAGAYRSTGVLRRGPSCFPHWKGLSRRPIPGPTGH